MKYEKAMRSARAMVVTALDVLAEREGSADVVRHRAVTDAMRHLVEAKRALDLYLDKAS